MNVSTSPSVFNIKEYYNYVFVELADARTRNWFMTDFPSVSLLIISYLVFVLHLGPKLMKDRKPFQFNNFLIFYNFLQVLLSLWLFWESLDGAWLYKYSWKCEPVDRSMSPSALRVARGVYVYYLSKASELLDTVFFVLRKKQNQVSFLHLYHHNLMLLLSWGAVRYIPGGHAIFIGFVNSFVHIWMYLYYMIAAMGPQYQKYLWWKKYITTMQLVQFVIVFIHNSQLLFYECGFPKWSLFVTLPNTVIFIYLFSNFYRNTYQQPEAKAVANGKSAQLNGHSGNVQTEKKKVK